MPELVGAGKAVDRRRTRPLARILQPAQTHQIEHERRKGRLLRPEQRPHVIQHDVLHLIAALERQAQRDELVEDHAKREAVHLVMS